MAKKVILKDLNEIEILPITRGELVLDSSGKKAFHSEEFLATSSLPGLMSKTDKTKVDNATTLSQAIPYIVGNASDSAGTWTGSYTGINEYTDGLTIIYVPKVAGASTTTLNINNLGAKTCHYTGTSKLTTHYSANTPILLTYLGGYWKRADYNVDTYTSAYSVTSGGTAGKTASCTGYQLKPNSYVHITFTNTNTYLGALTLNINTRGAKPIWINRNASSSSNYELPAGTYLAYYDGSSYHLRTDGTLPGIIEDSYGAKYISLYVNTLSSTLASKNKYYKFATIDLTDANWSECSINFLFAAIENTLPNGLLALSVRRGSSITALMGTLNWLSLDDEVYKDSVVLCNTDTDGVYDLYLQPKKDYCTVRITAITPQYTKLQMFRGGYFEEVTPRITSRLSGYVHHAEKITCTESTSNKDYPIISTYASNSGIYESLLYNPNITLNPSTGEVKATKFTGIFNGTSNLVANNLILKIKSGSTEGTSLYTYNGSSPKTLDIKLGNNITLTATAGALSIAASDAKVTQTDTTADADYRVIFSGNANNTTETTTVRKSNNLQFNPSSKILTSTYVNTKGISNKFVSDLEGLSKSGLYLSYLRCSKGSFTNETGISVSGNANGVIWVGTHAPEGTNTSEIGYGHMLGFIGGTGGLYHKVIPNGDTTGSWRKIAYTHSDITGNAASADKLKTKRKLWGLDFDGTANVSGDMSSVGSISMSGNIVQVKGENKFASNTYTDPASGFNAAMKIAGGVAQNGANVLLCTTSGKTGIGTINPSEKLEVNGNVKATEFLGKLHWDYITNKPTSFTPAAHTHSELTWTGDARNIATLPSDYKKVFKFVGIKSPSVIGLTEAQAGYWVSLIGWKGYNDNSGPYSWELASTNKERIYVRSGIGIQNSGSGNEDWKEWHNIAYTTDNFPSNQITSLLEYSKATSAADLATTDTLNVALGKLEYKAHYAYNWINTVTNTDLDEYINKWGEIVDFLDSVKEGTDILEEFVTVKTAQTISGQKTFSQPVLIKNENDRLTKIYSESQTEGVPTGNAGTVIQGGNFSHRLLLKDSFAGGCNYASLSGGYSHDGKLILNSYTIDTTAVTATVKSTTIISTAASSLGGSLSINGDLWFPAGNNNRFINFTSKSNTTFGTNSWRLGYWGSESGDKNYFILQSTTTTSDTWKNAFRITNETLFTEFYGNVKSTKFITSGGTASLFVKGDGSLDSTSYATSASLGNYLPLAGGTMTGNVVWKEGTGTSSRFPGHIYRNFWSTNGNVYDHFYPYGTTLTSNAYIRVWDGTTQSMRALLLAGSGSMKWCDKEVLHAGNYSNYLPTYDGNRMTKDTKFYKRYITVNGTNYTFVSNTNSSTSATIYAHTSIDKNKLSYSTASGLGYTTLKYLSFRPKDNKGYVSYLLIADLTNWVKGTNSSTYLIGTMYGQRGGNLSRTVVYNICAHLTSYTEGSTRTLYTDIYNDRVLQPYIVTYNGTKYLALKKKSSEDTVYFVGLAEGLLDTYIDVLCPNNTDLPEGLTIECSPTTTSIYLATTKVWDGTTSHNIIHSGNYTTYSGYIGTTKVQATGAELNLTGIKNLTATGSAIIKGSVYLGSESLSNLYFTRPSAAYIWASEAGGYLSFGVKDAGVAGNTNASLVILSANVLPGMRNDAVALGSSSYRWKNVYSKYGNFLNQVLIGTATALDTGCVLNVNGNTYQRGEFKITNDVYGVRLLGNGGFGYVLMGNISDITQPHYGKITGISARYLSSLDVDCLQTNLTGRLKVAYGLAITATSNQQFLLMGNQDGAGTNNPVVIKVANGILRFGNGDSWSDVNGGTFTEHLKITSSSIASARKINAPSYIANTAMSLKSSGLSNDLTAAGLGGLFSNGIIFTSPGTINDVGFIRILGTGESDTVLEIGTGDDGASTNSEAIAARLYRNGTVAKEAWLLDKLGNTIFPGTVTSTGFKKSNSSDSYALLGGGGHKALSDFALKSELNDLALSNNVITFSKEITVGSDWVDTGIVFNSTNFPLGNGSYLVLMSFSSGYYIYTGVMTIIISLSVSLTHSEEILLHGGGFDMGLGHYYLRTYGDATDKVFKLQLARASNSGTRTYTFKFIKLL